MPIVPEKLTSEQKAKAQEHLLKHIEHSNLTKEKLEILLQQGADIIAPNDRFKNGETALTLACKYINFRSRFNSAYLKNDIAVIDLLLNELSKDTPNFEKANIPMLPNIHDELPIEILPVTKSTIRLIEKMIRLGADINKVSLIEALQNQEYNFAIALLKRANTNLKPISYSKNRVPFSKPTSDYLDKRHWEGIKILLQYGQMVSPIIYDWNICKDGAVEREQKNLTQAQYHSIAKYEEIDLPGLTKYIRVNKALPKNLSEQQKQFLMQEFIYPTELETREFNELSYSSVLPDYPHNYMMELKWWCVKIPSIASELNFKPDLYFENNIKHEHHGFFNGYFSKNFSKNKLKEKSMQLQPGTALKPIS